jgi:hypothetical protein
MESVVRTSMTVRFLVEHYPNVDFTKFNVQRVVNLFENMKYPDRVQMLSLTLTLTCVCAKRSDQNSAKLRVCFRRVYVFASAATFNTVFSFFLPFKDEFLPTAFFIDYQFFDLNLDDSTL